MMKNKNIADCFENGWLKPEYVWPLRKEICLGSAYYSDYVNSFGIDRRKVCDFFDGFWDSFCEELAKEDDLQSKAKEQYEASDKTLSVEEIYIQLSLDRYDNEETLLRWYNCFSGGPEDSPLPPNIVNVDIHWDFARSMQVIATDEDEARSIVEQMMEDGKIPKESFEAEDWWLDTSYQP